jgi:hypothetical protein
MATVLHRAQAEAAAVLTDAGAGLPTDSSSSSRSSSGDPGGSSSLGVLQSLLSSLNHNVQLLNAVGALTIVEPDREARSPAEVQGTVAGYAWAPVWDSCAVEVVSVVEGYVRLLLSIDGRKSTTGALLSSRGCLPAVADVCSPAGVLLLVAEQILARAAAHSQAPASRRQRDPYLRGFMSLLVSTLKLAGSSTMQGTREGLDFCLAAAGVSATVLQKHMAMGGLDASAAAGTPSSSSIGVGSQQADAAVFVACLPWLVLLGRCCYHVSSHLLVLSEHSDPVLQPAAAGSTPNQTLVWLSWMGDQLRGTSSQLKVLVGAQQLVAAGYALQSVEEQLVVLLGVLDMQSAFGAVGMLADAAQAGFGQLAQRLRGFGVAASSIPVPDFCNNPGCVTARGQSEAELVLGRSCKCGGCRVARYCSRDCQHAQWAQHKPARKALAAAAAAGGGG